MNKNIVFFGTPEFAVSILDELYTQNYNIISVYTQTDKPKGRGNKVQMPPVKEYALSHDIPVYQPKTLRDETVISKIREMKPDLIVVAAYGKIFPKELLDIPPYGCINVHGSLLPKYRRHDNAHGRGLRYRQYDSKSGDQNTGRYELR